MRSLLVVPVIIFPMVGVILVPVVEPLHGVPIDVVGDRLALGVADLDCARVMHTAPGSDTPRPAFPSVSRGHAETFSVSAEGAVPRWQINGRYGSPVSILMQSTTFRQAAQDRHNLRLFEEFGLTERVAVVRAVSDARVRHE